LLGGDDNLNGFEDDDRKTGKEGEMRKQDKPLLLESEEVSDVIAI
jgi:hypothetical protein